jgi:hypothetical protein
MQKLHESIAGMLLGKPVPINENHAKIENQLNASRSMIGSEKPNFVHGKGALGQHETQEEPEHSSPVSHHYHHEGSLGEEEKSDESVHHITVSHHKDNTATVQHTRTRWKKSKNSQFPTEHISQSEKHFKDMPTAIAHVGKLKTPE